MSKTSVFFAILVSVAGASIGYAGEAAPPKSPAANAVKVTTDKTVDASSLDTMDGDFAAHLNPCQSSWEEKS